MTIETDLFGQQMTINEPGPIAGGNRKATVPRGYAAPPGTGPTGETCRSCEHYARLEYAKTYRKCAKMEKVWTHGPGTDIKASAPACRFWQKPTE